MRSDAIREYGGVASGDAPAGHGCATALGRRAAGADRTGCARRPIAGGVDIQTRQTAASRDLRNVRGARGDREGVPHRSRDCRGVRGSRGGLGGIPGRTRSRDTVAATPSAPNKRPPAHVELDTPRSPHATARQLHRGASRSNAGLYRLRRRTADRPATLNRTPARAADAAPGAVDPLRCTPTTIPIRRGSRSFPYRIDNHAVVDALGSPGVHRGLRDHTPRGRPCGRPSAPADSHPCEADRRGACCGARPELRPQAPAEGAPGRLARHAHGALLRAGSKRAQSTNRGCRDSQDSSCSPLTS